MVLKKGGGEGGETVRVRDLAQVVPRGGRMVVVMVGEEEVGSLHHAVPPTSYGFL